MTAPVGTGAIDLSGRSERAALRLGTRRSRLAMAQSQQVADALAARLERPVELVEVVTFGDRSTEALTQIGGTGVFVTALREALLDQRVDLAVHSLKDLPTAAAPDLVIAAVPPREDPRDVLVSPRGLTPRRAASRLPHRHRLTSSRGAAASTRDSSWTSCRSAATSTPGSGKPSTARSTQWFSPVPGSPGSAGSPTSPRCSTRSRSSRPAGRARSPSSAAVPTTDLVAAIAAALDDDASRAATAAERSLLAALEAGCTAPVGGLADVAEDEDGRARALPARRRGRHGRQPSDSTLRDRTHRSARDPRAPTRRRPARSGRGRPPGGNRMTTLDPPSDVLPTSSAAPVSEAPSSGAQPAAKRAAPRRGAAKAAPRPVAVLGCGPGDPDLLTVRAAALLAEADVVLDRSRRPRRDARRGARQRPDRSW